MSSSEVAREMHEHGTRVERQLEAQELHRGYEAGPIDRASGTVEIAAKFRYYTRLEIEQQGWDAEDWEAWEAQKLERERRVSS